MTAVAPLATSERRQLLTLIESMSRAGCPEWAIVEAVERASGRVADPAAAEAPWPARLARWFLGSGGAR